MMQRLGSAALRVNSVTLQLLKPLRPWQHRQFASLLSCVDTSHKGGPSRPLPYVSQHQFSSKAAPYEGEKKSRKIPEIYRTPIPAPRTYGQNIRPISATRADVRQERWNWLLRLMGYYRGETARIRHSRVLLNACAQHAARREFFENLAIEPRFLSQHAVLMLHIWLVHRRLVEEGEDGRQMDEALFDRLWDEVQVRIRALGVPEITVNKHLRDVQKVSFTACMALDQGLEQGLDALIEAVRKHVFLMDEEGRNTPLTGKQQAALAKSLTAVAKYVHRELGALRALPVEDVMIGDFIFGEPPPPGGNAAKYPDYHGPGVVWEGKWVEALDQRGRTYYWNAETRAVTWELPEDCDRQISLL